MPRGIRERSHFFEDYFVDTIRHRLGTVVSDVSPNLR
jgi:hypothetical protein